MILTDSAGCPVYNVPVKVIYIDVLFAVEAWMNMGLLYLTALGMGYERRGFRLFLGAAAGAAWTVLFAALPPAPLWLSLLVSYGAAGPSMCLAAYGFRGFRELFKSAVFLALATAFAGGALGQLYRHTGLGYAAGALNGGSLLLFLFLCTTFNNYFN